MNLTDKQKKVLASENHLLVTGGPGSGKTTISIFNAADILQRQLEYYQNILFLSFARASVSRVIEAIEHEHDIDPLIKKRIDVDTYHSFFWRILKTHGYLIGLPKTIDVLTPQREAITLSVIRNSYPPVNSITEEEIEQKNVEENQERTRLLYDEGLVCFDFFAQGVSKLLTKSRRVRDLIAIKYPVIIFDEFQDTNEEQWLAVKSLGKSSRMIALADPEQRIYDWIGADPERLQHFKDEFSPDEIDFGQQNHRSAGTDIAEFANDMLKGSFSKKSYIGITRKSYEPNQNQAYTELVSTVLGAIKRVKKSNSKEWSVAILVPTKKMTRQISTVLDNPPNPLPPVFHEPYIEVEAAMLSAEVIAYLMQPQIKKDSFFKLINLIINFLKGRGGDKPTKKNINEASSFKKALDEYLENLRQGKDIRGNSILKKTLETFNSLKEIQFLGNPENDWRSITKVLQDSNCTRLNQIADDAKNIRLLKRGEKIRQDFSLDWRENSAYVNALDIIRLAFVQQHFATRKKLEQGVLVMNMHKAKGKQFDEVVIFEDWPKRHMGNILSNSGRIVRYNLFDHVDDQCKQNFRVSITRARSKTTILTPKGNPCVLLLNNS